MVKMVMGACLEERHAPFIVLGRRLGGIIVLMCGRYLVTAEPELIMDVFHLSEPPLVSPTWNAAPTQQLPVVRFSQEGHRLDHLRWGLVPPWAKDLAIGNRMINARSETAADKPSFREAFRQRRCLVVVDGFYEWKREGDQKHPFCIRLENNRPFGLGGLWERWTSPEGEDVETFTILTTTPNTLMAPLHDRMPVIIEEEQHERWLAADLQDPGQVACLMRPFSAEAMFAYEVTKHVNSSGNNDEGCLVPANG